MNTLWVLSLTVGMILALMVVVAARRAGRAWLQTGQSGAGFRAKALLNRSEARLYRMIIHRLPKGYRLMAQVSYGEMLAHANPRHYHEVAARRADMVITDKGFSVVAVIEYQGAGHSGFTAADAIRIRRGDRLKRAALEAAGLVLIEVPRVFSAKTIDEMMAILFTDTAEHNAKLSIHRALAAEDSAGDGTASNAIASDGTGGDR